MKRTLLVLLLIFGFCYVATPKYTISACAIFRNEAPYLREWIEYHRLIGIEHFYLFNNLSEDDYLSILQPYIDAKIVELTDWPYSATNQKEWNKIQCSAYNTILKKKKFETNWLAIIDTDEFIVPIATKTLHLFLRDYEECSGIGINWQLYGTSHIDQIPPHKTLIGTLTKKAPTDYSRNHYIKSIVRPKRVHSISQPHFCKYKKPFYHVTADKTRFPKESLTPTISINKIRINHYTTRDGQFFNKEKKRRYSEWFPTQPPLEEDPALSSIEDDVIVSYVPELEQKLFH